MRVNMQVEAPENVRVKLEVVMTISQWQRISDSLTAGLKASWHGDIADFRNAIDSATNQISDKVSGDSKPIISE